MADKKRPKINWIAVTAVAAVVGVIATVIGIFWDRPIQVIDSPVINSPVINSPATPPVLTATIESFPYRHAETEISERKKEWREEWLQPLEDRLKKNSITPELLKTVVAAMEDLISDKIEHELNMLRYSIAEAEKWYSVTIRNDGDKPLKSVFLKFPEADFWIDERGRLARIPRRIEIGDMDQKSEERFKFWGYRLGRTYPKDGVVLGHSDGLGTIEFE